jgi:hypothetical protein
MSDTQLFLANKTNPKGHYSLNALKPDTVDGFESRKEIPENRSRFAQEYGLNYAKNRPDYVDLLINPNFYNVPNDPNISDEDRNYSRILDHVEYYKYNGGWVVLCTINLDDEPSECEILFSYGWVLYNDPLYSPGTKSFVRVINTAPSIARMKHQCKFLHIKGYSKMSKHELINALTKHGATEVDC